MNRRTTGPSLLACAFALLAPRLALADFTGLQTVQGTDLQRAAGFEPARIV